MLDLYKIGNRIALLRREKGLTGEKFAELLGVSPQAVSKWENGKNLPETAILPNIASLLGVSIDSILMPQELVILDARYTCGDEQVVITDILNRAVENNTLVYNTSNSSLEMVVKESAVCILTVKYQTQQGVFYTFAPQGAILTLNMNSQGFTIKEDFEILGAYYGIGNQYKSVIEKIAHYDYFKWDEIHVNHETFPSSPEIDESEYLTLVYINKNGIHVVSCAENGILRYINNRTALIVKDTSACILQGIVALEWETPDSDPKNIMPCTWAGALCAALNYMGEHYTYTQIMGLSGACWRITFCNIWDWSAMDALVAYSYDIHLYRAIGYVPVWACRLDKNERKTERRRIVADIQNGKPVVAINLRVAAEWGVITGYGDHGKIFYCRTYFDNHKLNPEKDYPESENWPFLICHFGEKHEKSTLVESLKNSLQALINSFEALPRDGYYQGKQGYEKWIEGIRNDSIWAKTNPENDLTRRFDVHLSTLYQLIDSRRCAADYLTECYDFSDTETVAWLIQIEQSCRKFASDLYSFKEGLLKHGVACFTDACTGKEMREQQATLLEFVLQDELKNVEIAKKVIEHLNSLNKNMICQVCACPLKEDNYSKEADGSINHKYCKWCYINGVHKYHDPYEVINDVVPGWSWGTAEQMADWLLKKLETLEYWMELANKDK